MMLSLRAAAAVLALAGCAAVPGTTPVPTSVGQQAVDVPPGQAPPTPMEASTPADASVADVAPVDPVQASPGAVTTSASGDRIEADVFRVAPDGRRVPDLPAYCRDAYGAIENARVVEEREDENAEADESGDEPPWPDPEQDLPHPDVATDPDADTSPCRGTSAQLATDPPGEPCDYGHAKAVTGYFYFDPESAAFRFVSSEDYEDYRRRGGDAGRWAAEFVCLDLFSGVADHASFAEVIAPPQFRKSPDPRGLTGADTWLWHDLTDEESHTIHRSFTVDAGGLPLGVDATIWVDEVRWDMDGDAEWDVAIDLPDTADSPATPAEYAAAGGNGAEPTEAVHTYQQKGSYQVRMEVRWRGVYEYVGYPGNTGRYQRLEVASTEEYPVCEVVAVRTAPAARLHQPGCDP